VLTPDRVVDAALEIVERDGVDQLSMRKLAAELGVSANSIYWHVGSREQVLEAVIARVGERYGDVPVQGRTPRERVLWCARQIWDKARDHHDVSVLAHELGHTVTLELPLQLALARELSAAGLRGAEAARALRGILYAVGGFIVIAYRPPDRIPPERTPERIWAGIADAAIDPGLLAALATPPDLDALFEHTIGTLVAALV
jgi:AcrR family transcriptional regulator